MGDGARAAGLVQQIDEKGTRLRSAERPRRYVAQHWLLALKPVLRYSITRDAFVLRGIGGSMGPVLRPDRRRRRQRSPFEGADRRRAGAV
jgi:hypothetical protein